MRVPAGVAAAVPGEAAPADGHPDGAAGRQGGRRQPGRQVPRAQQPHAGVQVYVSHSFSTTAPEFMGEALHSVQNNTLSLVFSSLFPFFFFFFFAK